MKSLTVALLLGATAAGYASPGLAADLIIEEPTEVGIVDVSDTWAGPYIGVFGGWVSGEYREPDGFTDDFSGWQLGAAVGANFAVTEGIVAGVVGDLAWTDAGFDLGPVSFNVNWAGSLRGRLGFDGGAFLPYLTAGLAVAGATIDAVQGSISNIHTGWTAGAGVEFAATEDLVIDMLYRYSDYGPQTYDFDGPAIPFDGSFTTHQITVGLNWRF